MGQESIVISRTGQVPSMSEERSELCPARVHGQVCPRYIGNRRLYTETGINPNNEGFDNRLAVIPHTTWWRSESSHSLLHQTTSVAIRKLIAKVCN